MACVVNWDRMPVYQEHYTNALPAGSDISMELDRVWTINPPRDIREAMELATKYYLKALELAGTKAISLVQRLATVANKLDVLYELGPCLGPEDQW